MAARRPLLPVLALAVLGRLHAADDWTDDAEYELFDPDGGSRLASAEELAVLPAEGNATERRLFGQASSGCMSCCSSGSCGQAFRNSQPGTCCNNDPPVCCPSGSECFGPNQCRRLAGARTFGGPGGHSSGLGGLVMLILICVLVCLCCGAGKACAGPSGGMPMGGGMMGGPGYGYGGGYGGGYPGGGGYGGGAMMGAGAAGLLGGLALGEMMGGGGGQQMGGMDYGYGGGGGGQIFAADGGGGGFGDGGGGFSADGGGGGDGGNGDGDDDDDAIRWRQYRGAQERVPQQTCQ